MQWSVPLTRGTAAAYAPAAPRVAVRSWLTLGRMSMNADQLAEIRPVLREVFDGAPDTCATLEVVGVPDQWVQVVDVTVNAAYPHSDDPEERIRRLALAGPIAALVGWEPCKYATFKFLQPDVRAFAVWIDAYFVHVLGCADGGYHLNATLQKI